MERETQQSADALRRALDGASGMEQALRQPLATFIERGVVSMEELRQLIATKVPAEEALAGTVWALNVLDAHGVAIVAKEHLAGICIEAVHAAPTPFSPPAPSKPPPTRVPLSIYAPAVRRSSGEFKWKKEAGGDDQWYHRRGEGVWYSPDMIAVCNTTASALELAYGKSKQGGK